MPSGFVLLPLLGLLLPIPGILGGGTESLLLDLVQAVHHRTGGDGNANISLCQEQILIFKDAWQRGEAWAIKVRDASGEGFGDFIMGHSVWLGSPTTCKAARTHMYVDMTERDARLLRHVAPFDLDHLVAYIWPNSSWHLTVRFKDEPLLHIGLCLPRSCSVSEVEQLIEEVLHKPVPPGSSSFRRWEMQPSLAYVKKPGLQPASFFGSRLVQLLLFLTGGQLLLCFLATGFGLERNSRLLACFDLRSNWQRAWHRNQEENTCINGLRVVTAFTLLALHVLCYKCVTVDHSIMLMEKVIAVTMRHSYWPTAMDFFFVISGYLTVLNFLRDKPFQQDIAQTALLSPSNMGRFGGQVLRRYLRLAPLQFIVMLGGSVSDKYQRQVSLMHVVMPHDEICVRYWWHNLLFVQNLFTPLEQCGNWTWSLACDMQLHVLALLLLFLHVRHPRLVRWLTGLLMLISVTHTIVMMAILQVSPNFEEFFDTAKWFYVSPLIRMMAYIVGGAYGYAQFQGWPTPLATFLPNRWSKLVLIVGSGWLVKEITAAQLPSSVILSMAIIVMRLLMSVWASNLILCGNGVPKTLCAPHRWLLVLLRSERVQQMSCFTYALYLINPIVVRWFYYSFTAPVNADTSIMILLTVGFSVICYIMAIGLTLIFELPLNRLASLLFNTRSSKGKSS
ncbi:hypothetical protein KR018_010342 [Drosophila ironensis]|nr:hypothetical protein KR018_010342 [Drosophila ironensis]